MPRGERVGMASTIRTLDVLLLLAEFGSAVADETVAEFATGPAVEAA